MTRYCLHENNSLRYHECLQDICNRLYFKEILLLSFNLSTRYYIGFMFVYVCVYVSIYRSMSIYRYINGWIYK